MGALTVAVIALIIAVWHEIPEGRQRRFYLNEHMA